jgi:hypothetical protein
MEGYLLVKGCTFSVDSKADWIGAWCILNGQSLQLHEGKQTNEALGTVSLELSIDSSSNCHVADSRGTFMFVIRTLKQGITYFRADNKPSLIKWVSRIQFSSAHGALVNGKFIDHYNRVLGFNSFDRPSETQIKEAVEEKLSQLRRDRVKKKLNVETSVHSDTELAHTFTMPLTERDIREAASILRNALVSTIGKKINSKNIHTDEETFAYEAKLLKSPKFGFGLHLGENVDMNCACVVSVKPSLNILGLRPKKPYLKGIKPGDLVVAINDEDIVAWPLSRLVEHLSTNVDTIGTIATFRFLRFESDDQGIHAAIDSGDMLQILESLETEVQEEKVMDDGERESTSDSSRVRKNEDDDNAETKIKEHKFPEHDDDGSMNSRLVSPLFEKNGGEEAHQDVSVGEALSNNRQFDTPEKVIDQVLEYQAVTVASQGEPRQHEGPIMSRTVGSGDITFHAPNHYYPQLKQKGGRRRFSLSMYALSDTYSMVRAEVTKKNKRLGLENYVSNIRKLATDAISEEGHTIILGWNESTAGVVVELVLQRIRQPRPSFLVRLFGDTKATERPGNVLILCGKTEKEMQTALESAFMALNFKWEIHMRKFVLFRTGDPTDFNELMKVRINKAKAIITMTTDLDDSEFVLSGGKLHNGSTLKSLLAIRTLIFSDSGSDELSPALFRNRNSTKDPRSKGEKDVAQDLEGITFNDESPTGNDIHRRILLHLTKPSPFIDAICFRNQKNEQWILPLQTYRFIDSMLFSCASNPGAAQIYSEMLRQSGHGLRCVDISLVCGGPDDSKGGLTGLTYSDAQDYFSDASLVGLISGSSSRLDATIDMYSTTSDNEGLCPDPSTILKERDILVFVGMEDIPKTSSDAREKVLKYRAVAMAYTRSRETSARPRERNLSKTADSNLINLSFKKEMKDILICGWKLEWGTEPERLRKQVLQLAQRLGPGCMICFMNDLSIDLFDQVMQSCKFCPTHANRETAKTWIVGNACPGVFISYFMGESSSHSDMDSLFEYHVFQTILVCYLSSQVGGVLNREDHETARRLSITRTLNTMVVLRYMYKQKYEREKIPMHVVVETCDDSTAMISVPPSGPRFTDFINIQAISSRILTVAILQPKMRRLLCELFDDNEATANVVLIPALDFLKAMIPETATTKPKRGVTPTARQSTKNAKQLIVNFGVVRQLVAIHSKSVRIRCIGIVGPAGPIFNPKLKDAYQYTKHDRLLCISKELIDL